MKQMILCWINPWIVLLGLPFALVNGCEKNETTRYCPALLSPENNTTLDNGCYDFNDVMFWHFEWEVCSEATAYNLVVFRNPSIPYIDLETSDTQYTDSTTNYIADFNRVGWNWKVRACVDGAWRDWSEIRRFNVELLNSDCAK